MRSSLRPVHITLSLLCGEQKRHNRTRGKYWEIIADNLSKAGWSCGWVSAVDLDGRTIFVVNEVVANVCNCRRLNLATIRGAQRYLRDKES
jgi:hypothetical protein